MMKNAVNWLDSKDLGSDKEEIKKRKVLIVSDDRIADMLSN